MNKSKGRTTYYAIRTIGSTAVIPGTRCDTYQDAKKLLKEWMNFPERWASMGRKEIVRVEVTPV